MADRGKSQSSGGSRGRQGSRNAPPSSKKSTKKRRQTPQKRSPKKGAPGKARKIHATVSRAGKTAGSWKRRLAGMLLVLAAVFVLAVLSVVFFPSQTLRIVSDDSERAPRLPEEYPVEDTVPDVPERDRPGRDEPHQYPVEPADTPERDDVDAVFKGERLLAFVIDDAGYSLEQLDSFLESGVPLTIAVMPHLAYSVPAAQASFSAGKEVILHMPMEPLDSDTYPGPGAIYVDDSDVEIERKTADALDSVPHAVGANNHMGSRASESEAIMRAFAASLRTYNDGLLLLDSRTTAESTAAAAAAQEGVPFVERDIFLDNEDERVAIIQAVEEGKAVADKRGYAVMIGHAWSNELGNIITELYPELMEQGYSLVTLTELLGVLAQRNR